MRTASTERTRCNTDLSAVWQQAIAHFEAERYAESEALCVQLIQQAPDKPLAYALLARICHAVGLVREATFNAFQASQRVAANRRRTSSRSARC